MNLLDEIINSAKQSLSERLSSPLIVGFLVSWSLWNWKFLVILFSNNSVSKTFDLVDKYSFSAVYDLFLRGFMLPLISSMIYIFLYPYPAKFVYGYSLNRQREANELKQKINDETLLTIEDSQRIRAEYVEYERKKSQQLAELNEEITQLKAVVEKYERTEKNKMEGIGNQERLNKNDLTSSQFTLLEIMSNNKLPMQENGLIADSGLSRVKAQYDIGELLRMKLIDRNFDARGDHLIDFTHSGRGALLNKKTSS